MNNMKKLLVISLLLLSACANTYEGVSSGLAEDSRNIRARIADNIYPEQGPHKSTEGRYVYPATECYKTWSGNVCYDAPTGATH